MSNLIIITIRRIQSFIAVAEFGGFRRAADELAISQPALSAHVRELEEYLGVQLLRRTTRKVQLTSEGEVFLARSTRALDELHLVVSEIKERAAVQRGRVVVASVPSISANALPVIVAGFMQENPGVTVQIVDDRPDVIEHRVERSEVDFAIGPVPEHRPDLEFHHLVDDPFMAIIPLDHPLANEKRIPVEKLVQHPLITMRTGLHMRRILDAGFTKAKVPLRPTYEVNHHDTLTAMVEAGLGIGTLPSLTISIIRRPTVAAAPIVSPRITRQIGIIQRRGEPLAPAAQKFSNALRAYLGKQLPHIESVSKPIALSG